MKITGWGRAAPGGGSLEEHEASGVGRANRKYLKMARTFNMAANWHRQARRGGTDMKVSYYGLPTNNENIRAIMASEGALALKAGDS